MSVITRYVKYLGGYVLSEVQIIATVLVHPLRSVCTHLDSTEQRRLDPMSNVTSNFQMPPNKRNEDCGNDIDDNGNGNGDDCDDDGDGNDDIRKKE